MSIYTKNGDKGFTSTLDGVRYSKSAEIICAIGDVDELNAVLGVLITAMRNSESTSDLITKVQFQQQQLLKLGAVLASCTNEKLLNTYQQFNEQDIKRLEADIDLWQANLPELKNFILPGGNRVSALAHLARSVCRRAERSIVCLAELAPKEVLQYINRLSDWLFVLARVLSDGEEVIWRE